MGHQTAVRERVKQRLEHPALRAELVIHGHSRHARLAGHGLNREARRPVFISQQLTRGVDDLAPRFLGGDLTLAEVIGAWGHGTWTRF